MDGGYDSGYAACKCFWGRNPGSLVRRLIEDLNVVGMKVLDAGCGEGKNAAFLASLGAHVRAVDVSMLALRNAKAEWGTLANVSWEMADIRGLSLPHQFYDIVIAYGVLHCLPRVDDVVAAVHQFQEATSPGGYNVVCAFNNRRQELAEAHSALRPSLLSHAEYQRLYSAWQSIVLSDADLLETHPDKGIPHTHSLTRLIARKPR